jgi:hypothetical protein
MDVIVSRNPGSGLLTGIWTCVFLASGLVLTATGIMQYISASRGEKTGRETGAWIPVTQIVFGILVAASLVWFHGWVEFDYSSPVVIREGLDITLHYLTGWYIILILWKGASFALGLAATVCGMLELIKARSVAG